MRNEINRIYQRENKIKTLEIGNKKKIIIINKKHTKFKLNTQTFF